MICVNQICLNKFVEMHNLAKKMWKGRQEWEKACANLGLPPQKLNTLVKTS